MTALYRPEPHLDVRAASVDRTIPAGRVAERLLQGTTAMVTDAYGTGADILDALRELLRPPPATAPYASRQAFQEAYRTAALHLLAPVIGHRVALDNAAQIGFLAELYPELDRFALPLVEIQDLHGAWRRYQDGVHMPVLGRKVHPFYGTYAPTRMSHLELFGTWLSQYTGARAHAIDVGTGCGVLAFMLCRAGFERVRATDSNPNAIESVRREISRHEAPPSIVPVCTDLLGDDVAPADLVVFNPPWVQGTTHSLLDQARHFDPSLFERFFAQARAGVKPEGRVVLLFSNLIELVQPEVAHPIQAELARGRFTLVQKMRRKVKTTPDASGRARRSRERVEVWELAPA